MNTLEKPKERLKNIRYFDNTRLSDHRLCNRYFYIRHELGWTKTGVSLPLAFGGSWHAAMDHVWEAICWAGQSNIESIARNAYEQGFLASWRDDYNLLPDMEMDPTDVQAAEPRTTSIAYEMLINYVSQRLEYLQTIELLHIELPFAVPLIPDREEYFYVGRIDKAYVREGDIYVGEHKTSSMYAKSGFFRSNVLESYSPNSQIDGYKYALSMMLKKPVLGVMVDLALVHKTVHEGFRLVPTIRSDQSINAWHYEAQHETRKIFENLGDLERADEATRANLGFLPAFPKNTNNCQGKYGPCQFKDICQFSDDPESLLVEDENGDVHLPAGFEKNIWEPFEFNKLSDLGLEAE